MRPDPRSKRERRDERLGWALLHDLIAHPLLALTLYSRPAQWLHDWTSARAWPAPSLTVVRSIRRG